MKSKIDIDNKIDAYIKENENGDITATQLNEILKEINAALFGFMDTYLSTPFSSLGGETVITKFSKLTEQLTGIADRVTALENGGGGSTDNYALSGSFSYSGNIAASGGTKTPTNTLGITKNGVAVSGVTITYSSNQSYAVVNSNGMVTMTSHTNTSARTATITATVTDGTHTFTKTANVTQSAYVAPTETLYTYVGWAKTNAGTPVEIDNFVSKKQTVSTTKTINVTVNELANTIIVLCPSTMSLTLCESQALKEDISSTMNMTTVTYNGKSYKMYQHRYGSSINGTEFKINFN